MTHTWVITENRRRRKQKNKPETSQDHTDPKDLRTGKEFNNSKVLAHRENDFCIHHCV